MRKINRDAFHNSNLDSTDFLISLDWIKNPQEFLRRSTPGTAEIVCHPERQKEFEIIKEYF
jgi:hypothetical protein